MHIFLAFFLTLRSGVVVQPLSTLHHHLLQVPWGPVTEVVQGLVPHNGRLVVGELDYPLPNSVKVLHGLARTQLGEDLLPLLWIGMIGSGQVVIDGHTVGVKATGGTKSFTRHSCLELLLLLSWSSLVCHKAHAQQGAGGEREERRKEKGGVEKNGGIEEGRKEGKGQAELK